MGYNLTDQQKQLLRDVAAAYDAGAKQEFYSTAVMSGRWIQFSDVNRRIDNVQVPDLIVLAEHEFITLRQVDRHQYRGAIRQAGIDAVKADFVPPPEPSLAPVFHFNAPVGAVQTGQGSTATVTQSEVAAAGELLARLGAMESRINAVDVRDRDLVAVFHELQVTLRHMQQDPDDGKAMLAAMAARLKPWADFGAVLARIFGAT